MARGYEGEGWRDGGAGMAVPGGAPGFRQPTEAQLVRVDRAVRVASLWRGSVLSRSGYHSGVETLQLRPLDLGGVVTDALTIVRRRFGSLAAVGLVLPAPVSAALSALIEFPAPPAGQATLQEVTDWIAAAAPIVFFQFLVASLASVVAAVAVFRLTAAAYAGLEQGWRSALGYAFTRLLPILGVYAVVLLAVSLGTLLFILPGLFLIVSWAVWPGPLAVENQGVRGCLRRSWCLVHSRWWHIFGVAAATTLVVTAARAAATVLPAMFIPGRPFSILWSALVGALSEMFLFATLAVAYLELRVRNEGLDAERLSLEIRASAPDW